MYFTGRLPTAARDESRLRASKHRNDTVWENETMAKKKTTKSKRPLFKWASREFRLHNEHLQERAAAILECTDPQEAPRLVSSYLRSVRWSLDWLNQIVQEGDVAFPFTVRIKTTDEIITIPDSYNYSDGKMHYEEIERVDKGLRASRKAKKAKK